MSNQFRLSVPKKVVRLTLPQSITISVPSPQSAGLAPSRRKPSSVTVFSKRAAAKSNDKSKPAPETRSSFSSKKAITPTPEKMTGIIIPVNESLTDVGELVSADLVFHLLRSVEPGLSLDERMFLLLSMDGLNRAVFLAPKFHWRYQRPLRALRAAMRERGNHHRESTKRKRPFVRES